MVKLVSPTDPSVPGQLPYSITSVTDLRITLQEGDQVWSFWSVPFPVPVFPFHLVKNCVSVRLKISIPIAIAHFFRITSSQFPCQYLQSPDPVPLYSVLHVSILHSSFPGQKCSCSDIPNSRPFYSRDSISCFRSPMSHSYFQLLRSIHVMCVIPFRCFHSPDPVPGKCWPWR